MRTIYPTLNWKDLALRLARTIEEGDQDAMDDAVKDARLFEGIPCPSVTLGGPHSAHAHQPGGTEMKADPLPTFRCRFCRHPFRVDWFVCQDCLFMANPDDCPHPLQEHGATVSCKCPADYDFDSDRDETPWVCGQIEPRTFVGGGAP